MHMNSTHRFGSARSTRSRDRIEYRALVALSYLPCLAVAMGSRLTGGDGGGQSVFAQARAAAHAAIGYAFQG
jgi:hypothetical protein